jgi:putative addiction module component (TIGR02574 family)
MSIDVSSLEVDRLSIGERLELIEKIWDSLPESLTPDEVPPEHIVILEKRRAAAKANPGVGKPWRDVLDQLGKKP